MDVKAVLRTLPRETRPKGAPSPSNSPRMSVRFRPTGAEEIEPPRFIDLSLDGPVPEFYNRLQNLSEALTLDTLAKRLADMQMFLARHRPQMLPQLIESGLGAAQGYFARVFGEKDRPRAAVDALEVQRAVARAPSSSYATLLKHLYNFYWTLSLQVWESRFHQLSSQCARAVHLQAVLTEKGATSDLDTRGEAFLRGDGLLGGCEDPAVAHSALNRFYHRAFTHYFPDTASRL